MESTLNVDQSLRRELFELLFFACYGARFLVFNLSVIYSQFGIARIMEIAQLGSATFTLSFKQTFNGKESLSVACV